jgi:hypothetical protein
MMIYYQKLRKLETNFDSLKYLHILRGKNEILDELTKLGSNRAMVPLGFFMQELHEPSITNALGNASKVAESSQETTLPIESISESPKVMEIHLNWRTPFMIYLRIGDLSEDKDEREELGHRAEHYTLVKDELFW